MQIYATEEEQVESLKKWWKENGRSIIAGLVLGLGGVFGWRAWEAHQANVGEQASVLFEQLMMSVTVGAMEAASQQTERLISEYDSTPYAAFGALAMARMQLDAGDTAGARSQLRWVLATAKDPGIEQVARLRLARILLTDGDSQGATETLQGQFADAFAGDVAALRGDIALAGNDTAGARAAYEEALAKGVGNATLVRMKLDDLEGGSETDRLLSEEKQR